MTIGIPRALPYYHFGLLWEVFFKELDIPYLLSDNSTQKTVTTGVSLGMDETCLPYKLYMGHIASLIGKADKILVPYLKHMGSDKEFCLRYWGLYDTVSATFPEAKLLSYPLASGKKHAQLHSFLALGKTLGKNHNAIVHAYRKAQIAQQAALEERQIVMSQKLQSTQTKVLLAGQDYLLLDPLFGGNIQRELENLGVLVISCDAWEKGKRNLQAQKIAPKLYWHKNREILGAIEQGKYLVDGVILLGAFPCGADSLTHELVFSRIKHLPIMQVLVDEHQGREGLLTRLESFIDLLEAGKNISTQEAI